MLSPSLSFPPLLPPSSDSLCWCGLSVVVVFSSLCVQGGPQHPAAPDQSTEEEEDDDDEYDQRRRAMLERRKNNSNANVGLDQQHHPPPCLLHEARSSHNPAARGFSVPPSPLHSFTPLLTPSLTSSLPFKFGLGETAHRASNGCAFWQRRGNNR